MAGLLFILIIILFVVGASTGNLLKVMPWMFLLLIFSLFSMGISILSWLIRNPWALLIVVILYLLNKRNRPKSKRKFYYYSSSTGTGKGNQQDFEEFFRNSGFQYGEGGGYYNQSGTGFGNIRDRAEDYRTLGLEPGATKEEVKKAYRDAVKKHHPDRHQNSSESEKAHHEKMIKKINESYENILKDVQ